MGLYVAFDPKLADRFNHMDTHFREISPGVDVGVDTDVDIDRRDDASNRWNLVVWNDDVNTFDWVIQALVEICHHSNEQAMQCALLIHTKGRYEVKTGSRSQLKPMCEGILDRSIQATLEESAS
jgi:ATP-dependent Clp protease adaptor protein ClpS